MKTAIYIEDGTVQLVLTPETEFEQDALRSFEPEKLETQMFRGSFYDCRGGWVRQTAYRGEDMSGICSNRVGDISLILRAQKKSLPSVLETDPAVAN